MFEANTLLQDRYQLQKRLGNTGTGRQTWLALDQHSTHPSKVIVKLLAFNPQMQWDELKLFEREAEVLRSLNHPRIPKYLDYFSIDDRVLWFGLVQQYIPGISLQQLLDDQEILNSENLQQLAVNLLHILIYLHELHPPVLHRDIKPSNLILGDDGYTYLIDFGAVQNQAAITGMTFTVVGTCGYTPLEQFWGRAIPASDIYALGATLIHLATGIAPADLPQKNGRIQLPSDLEMSPRLQSWIEKATEAIADQRFTTAREALQGLQSGVGLPNKLMTTPSQRLPFSKPPNSKVELTRYPTSLEIHIPPPLQFWQRFKLSTEMGCTSFLIFLFSSLFLSGFINIFFPVLSTPTSFLLAIAFLYAFLVLWNEHTYLTLGTRTFKLERRAFGMTYSTSSDAIANIRGVFLESRPDVCLRLETHGLRLANSNNRLTEAECLWLAQEIQDWLNSH